MKGDKLEDRIKAAQLIVEHGTCHGVLEVWCLSCRLPKGKFPCPNRKGLEPGWSCDVASAKAFIDRHASPVTPDAESVGQDAQGVGQDAQGAQKAQERETIQGPRFDTTRERARRERNENG